MNLEKIKNLNLIAKRCTIFILIIFTISMCGCTINIGKKTISDDVDNINVEPEDVTNTLNESLITNLNSKLSYFNRMVDEFNRVNYDERTVLTNCMLYIKWNYLYCPEKNNLLTHEEYSEVIEKDEIDLVASQLFGVAISEDNYLDDSNDIYYKNGKYFRPAADGAKISQFSFVDKIIDNKDGTFTIEFTNYQLNFNDLEIGSSLNRSWFENKSNWPTEEHYSTIGKGVALAELINITGKDEFAFMNYSKEYINPNESIQENSKKKEYIKKLDNIDIELSYLDYLLENATTIEMKEILSEKYSKWDDTLNEIYALLKVQLSNEDMNIVQEKQIAWIEYRDMTAENESSVFEGGTFYSVQYITTLTRLTKERCYELVNLYL